MLDSQFVFTKYVQIDIASGYIISVNFIPFPLCTQKKTEPYTFNALREVALMLHCRDCMQPLTYDLNPSGKAVTHVYIQAIERFFRNYC